MIQDAMESLKEELQLPWRTRSQILPRKISNQSLKWRNETKSDPKQQLAYCGDNQAKISLIVTIMALIVAKMRAIVVTIRPFLAWLSRQCFNCCLGSLFVYFLHFWLQFEVLRGVFGLRFLHGSCSSCSHGSTATIIIPIRASCSAQKVSKARSLLVVRTDFCSNPPPGVSNENFHLFHLQIKPNMMKIRHLSSFVSIMP